MPANRAGSSPPADPLDRLLALAADQADDPDVVRWLSALAAGEHATSCDGPRPRQPDLLKCE